MLNIPLLPVPAQELSVTLDGQRCQIRVYQKFTGMFLDLYVDNALVIGGVICEDANRIVRSTYLGFSGDLAFFDSTGSGDPTFAGLGTQFILCYLSEADLEEFGLAA